MTVTVGEDYFYSGKCSRLAVRIHDSPAHRQHKLSGFRVASIIHVRKGETIRVHANAECTIDGPGLRPHARDRLLVTQESPDYQRNGAGKCEPAGENCHALSSNAIFHANCGCRSLWAGARGRRASFSMNGCRGCNEVRLCVRGGWSLKPRMPAFRAADGAAANREFAALELVAGCALWTGQDHA